jgi:hypothetical protein
MQQMLNTDRMNSNSWIVIIDDISDFFCVDLANGGGRSSSFKLMSDLNNYDNVEIKLTHHLTANDIATQFPPASCTQTFPNVKLLAEY